MSGLLLSTPSLQYTKAIIETPATAPVEQALAAQQAVLGYHSRERKWKVAQTANKADLTFSRSGG